MPDDLGARLRALRGRYPGLAVTTAIVHQTDRLIVFRATVCVDALPRAQGHAARCAEPTGAFVAAAEALAVAQALLLGGFDPAAGAVPLAAWAHGDAAPHRTDLVAARAATAGPTATGDEDASGATATTRDARGSADAAATVAVAAPAPTREDAAPTPAPRPRRDRRAERARAGAAAAALGGARDGAGVAVGAVAAPAPPTVFAPEASAPERAGPTTATGAVPEVAVVAAEKASGTPVPAPYPTGDGATVPTPSAAPRRGRARPPAGTPPVAPAPDAPPTREALRAAWRGGRPIPAWWPRDRPVVTRPLGKARVGRLRALALAEEIPPALLDAYSALLFGAAVAALDQAQGALLEERLDPAYPSPLEELRARRILHPLAVGDDMDVPPDRPFLVRWRDVPPVEAAPPPIAPPPPSWRDRGKGRGGGRR